MRRTNDRACQGGGSPAEGPVMRSPPRCGCEARPRIPQSCPPSLLSYTYVSLRGAGVRGTEPWWPSPLTGPPGRHVLITRASPNSGLGLAFVGADVGLPWSATSSRSSPVPSNPLLPLGERVALSGLLTRDTRGSGIPPKRPVVIGVTSTARDWKRQIQGNFGENEFQPSKDAQGEVR